MRVVVIGAGLAGLAAADELARGGDVEVIVLEARDRVGGRVWSVPFGGTTVERGAEWVLPGNDTLTGLAERFGLALVLKGTTYGNREPRGAAGPVAIGALAAAASEAHAGAAGEPGLSARDALRGVDVDALVADVLEARLEVSTGHPAGDLESESLAEAAAALGDFDTWTIAGGNDRLATALASAVGSGLHLSTPARRVAWGPEGVSVATDDGEVEGDAAILSVPATVVGEIEFDPPLPAAKARAHEAVVYGDNAKLFVALRTAAPPSATLSVPERYWCWTQLGADGGPLPVLGALAGTTAAIDALRLDAGPDTWLASLGWLRPDLELETETSLLSTWRDDPWVRGAYTVRSTSSPLDDAEVARPLAPLFFAGEHTAGEFHGLMEGALRSGLRAAQEARTAAPVRRA